MEFSSIHLIKLARMLLNDIGLFDAKCLLDLWMNAISGEIKSEQTERWLTEEFVRFLLKVRDGAIKYNTETHTLTWNLQNPDVTNEDIVNILKRNGKSRDLSYNQKGD